MFPELRNRLMNNMSRKTVSNQDKSNLNDWNRRKTADQRARKNVGLRKSLPKIRRSSIIPLTFYASVRPVTSCKTTQVEGTQLFTMFKRAPYTKYAPESAQLRSRRKQVLCTLQ
jgi:hypothetical protein